VGVVLYLAAIVGGWLWLRQTSGEPITP
jgi:hypothetical protein